MENYTDKTYGERIADIYDEWYADFDPEAVNTLSELAQGGRALELGIGTGRIALPLAKSGVEVSGIDASAAMVARLQAKPGGDMIAVTMGNFADVAVKGEFSLIYVVFNTLYSLLSQEEQIRCFNNVVKHLTRSGVFAIEAFVPDMSRYTAGQAMRVTRIEDRAVHMDVAEHEQDKQLISGQQLILTEQGTKFYPVRIRYIWPSEMDLMARLAGLELKARWSDWKKSKFTADSSKHISIYHHPN